MTSQDFRYRIEYDDINRDWYVVFTPIKSQDDEEVWEDLEDLVPEGFDRMEECSYDFYMSDDEAYKILDAAGFQKE